ncbi:GreA/GreB family elongation factor [bacterium]|nr:GreA/GreB family elongation factor [bacterium]
MAKSPSRLENQILHFSSQDKWDKVHGLWPQIVDSPPESPRFYAALAKRATQAEKTPDFKAWILLLAESLEGKDNPRHIVQVCRGVLHVVPLFEELRQPLLDAIRSQYEQHSHLQMYLEASGLLHEPELYDPLNRFLQFVQNSEGQVFRHDHWGAGVVTQLDINERRVFIRFQDDGEKSFSFQGVKEFLKRLPLSHFLSQRLLNPEALKRKAQQTPVEFLKYCLKHLPTPMNRADLKEVLLQGIFDQKEWNSWWARNRDLFRFDPYIGFTGSVANPKLELRDEPKSYHEEVLADFRRADNFARQYALTMEMLKNREAEPIPTDAARTIFKRLQDDLGQTKGDNLAQRIQYLYLIDDLCQAVSELPAAEGPSPASLLLATPQPAEIIGAISIFDYQVRAGRQLRESAPESWPDRAEHLFLSAPVRLAQWVLREMIDSGDIDHAAHMAEQMLHRPYENPETYLWMVRAYRENKFPEIPIEVAIRDLFDATLDLINECQLRVNREDSESGRLRGLKSRLENLLLENHQAMIIEVFTEFENEETRTRHSTIMNNPALSKNFRLAFDSAARTICFDLEGADGGESAEHFVTAGSLETRQKEYQHIKSFEIPENTAAIGAAASHGDLSENAEYESAKERQKILFRRLEALEDLLQRARVVDPEHIDTRVVGFGTRFRVRDQDTGREEQYELLGVWDADPENHVLSYLTPFGKQFLNRKVGDSLVINHPGGGSTRYIVLEIKNALEGKAAARN